MCLLLDVLPYKGLKTFDYKAAAGYSTMYKLAFNSFIYLNTCEVFNRNV